MNVPLLEPGRAGRRVINPREARRFRATMRNDFLTPRGTPYKWQELAACVDRVIAGDAAPSVVPVRYRWERVESRTGTPSTTGQWREWKFARGQSFRSVLLHTGLAGGGALGSGQPPATILPVEVRYPELPKAPAVDLLLMVSWDVVTFEMMATHLVTTPELRTVGSSAEVQRISGTWADLEFSDPGANGAFHNARMDARHLGCGQVAGRASAVYSTQCLDCRINIQSGPVTQRGRSSYWVTIQVDIETGDLLSADMTEMIVATLTGKDGRQVPVQKRRTVRMWAEIEAGIEAGAGEATPAPADGVDPAILREAVSLAERVSGHVQRQAAALEKLPQGAAARSVMGFRGMVGADPAEVHRQLRSLQTTLQAAAGGDAAAATTLRQGLPGHCRQLEGLLAFGQVSVDEATRRGARDEPGRKGLYDYLARVRTDLTGFLALLERLTRGGAQAPPRPPSPHQPSTTEATTNHITADRPTSREEHESP